MGSRTGYTDGREQDAAPLYQKSWVRDYTETILVCVIFVVFSRSFVFQQSKIPSGSMMDTLLIGDYIMVNRFVYAPSIFDFEKKLLPMRDIERGDVVVFKKPDKPEVDYIKRVIGLPGDTVELREGRLFVNEKSVDESYVSFNYRMNDSNKNFGPTVVEEGKYFVMGDHRDASSDSREWGQVPRELMKGRALLIWWSYDETGEKSGKKRAPPPANPNVRQTLGSWWDKILNFRSNTRWRRCFSLIH